jgi:hypothetical protein
MVDAGAAFANIVRGWQTPYTYIERQMPCSLIHPLCGGTPDAWAWDSSELLIRVADLKFGHRYVDVFDNAQLATYTAGIVQEMKIDGQQDQYISVEWTIYQPRAYHRAGPVKTMRCMLSDLRPLFNRLNMAALDAVGDAPRCQPSEQCRDCTGRHVCVALQRAAASTVQFTSGTLEEFTLSPDQVGRELQRLEHAQALLSSRIEGLQEQAIADIRSGKRVSGYELTNSTGREIWREESKKQVAGMAQLMGIELLKPRELMTPSQARNAGFDVDLFDLSFKPVTGVKLTPVDLNQTRKIFGA